MFKKILNEVADCNPEYDKEHPPLIWEYVHQHEPIFGSMARAKVVGGYLYRHSDIKNTMCSLVFVPVRSLNG